MADEFKASIVIPTYNRGHLVSKAIETALSQTVKCEVIVCDHGSTDETSKILKDYGSRVKYIRREKDNGPIFCWLDGIINTSTDYVHLTYDDDWLDPNFMEECLSLFQEQCAFVFTGVEIHSSSGCKSSLYKDCYQTGIYSGNRIENNLMEMQLTISPGCGLFRKSDILPALMVGGLPNQKFNYHGAGPDLLMYLLPLVKYTHFGFVNKPLAHFLAHENSITTNAEKEASRSSALRDAYMQAKHYYLIYKYALNYNLGEKLYDKHIHKTKIKRYLVHIRNKLIRKP